MSPTEGSGKKPKLKSKASQFLPSTRWMAEVDYRDRLSPEDQEYLDRFNEAVAGANPQFIYGDSPEDTEKKNALYIEQVNMRRSEAMTGALHGVQMDDPSANPEDAIIELIDRHDAGVAQTKKEAAAADFRARVAARRAAREAEEEAKKKKPASKSIRNGKVRRRRPEPGQ